MKAVLLDRFGGPESLRLAEVPPPEPSADEILVRVRACALNHLDIWVRNGIPAYRIKLPHILGCDIAGEIAADSGALIKGTKVAVFPGKSCGRCEACGSGRESQCPEYGVIGAQGGRGGYAEFVSVPAKNVFAVDASLGFEEAASFPLTFLTAWHMLLTHAMLQPGQTVLVMGAGSGVGVAAIQIARYAGAQVIAASTSEEKLRKAQALGAGMTIHAPPEDIYRKVISLTEGRGVDVVFEHVGPPAFDKGLKALRPGGILVTCGSTTGPTAELDMRYVFSRELRIQGAKMGTLAEFHQIVKLVNDKRLKPVVDSVLPLADARKAHERLEARCQFGKVVLAV